MVSASWKELNSLYDCLNYRASTQWGWSAHGWKCDSVLMKRCSIGQFKLHRNEKRQRLTSWNLLMGSNPSSLARGGYFTFPLEFVTNGEDQWTLIGNRTDSFHICSDTALRTAQVWVKSPYARTIIYWLIVKKNKCPCLGTCPITSSSQVYGLDMYRFYRC